jgi:hypothetical protein
VAAFAAAGAAAAAPAFALTSAGLRAGARLVVIDEQFSGRCSAP